MSLRKRRVRKRKPWIDIKKARIEEEYAHLSADQSLLLSKDLEAKRKGYLAEIMNLEEGLLAAEAPDEDPYIIRMTRDLSEERAARPRRLFGLVKDERASAAEQILSKRIAERRETLRGYAALIRERIDGQRLALFELGDRLEALRAVRSRQKSSLIIAQAAAYRGEARAPADELKRSTPKPDVCPYCERCATAFEMDHIRPVSKGGLSDPSNCVWVCISCNREKGALLLRQFCQAKGWDFETIALRLENMGKEI